MYKLRCIYVLFIFPFLMIAQIGIHGDVYIASTENMAIYSPNTTFYNGVIKSSENQPGSVIFNANSVVLSANIDSYIDTFVTNIETPNFTFPVGDDGIYQPLRIENGDNNRLTVKFRLQKHGSENLVDSISKISDRFYWETKGNTKAKVFLSWNTFSDVNLITEEIGDLVIVGFNGNQWEQVSSQVASFSFDSPQTRVSITEGSISSRESIDFSKYEAFTLGAIKRPVPKLLISESITPNGDGINDVWYIRNIELYPDSSIKVYNRWGLEVYSSSRYKNDWDGTYKNNTEHLPNSSYYYTIDTDNDGGIDFQGWIYLTK